MRVDAAGSTKGGSAEVASGFGLIGRETERAVLEEALEGARAGRARVVAIGGPAGIGKSRLVRWLAQVAEAEGVAVHVAACPPITASGPIPHAPFAALGRSLVRQLDARRLHGLLGPMRRPLSALVPELGVDDVPPAEPDAGPLLSQAMQLLFEVTARATGPFVVCLEDLQWAGPTALSMLAWLVQELGATPVLILATHRQDGQEAGDLLGLLAELGRSEHVDRLDLEPLPSGAARTLLDGLLTDHVPADIRADILRRADGVPLYIEELAVGSGSDVGPPLSVRASAARRMGPLDRVAVQLVRSVAISGRAIDWRVVASAVGTDESTGMEAVRAGMTAGLLVAASPGPTDVRIRHVLVGEAVLAGMVPGEAALLAERLAEAITRSGRTGGSMTAEGSALLASLLLTAGRPDDAIGPMLRVAADAMQRGAYDEAHVWYGRVLSLAGDRLPALVEDAVVVFDGGAWAAWLAGEPERAADLGARALAAGPGMSVEEHGRAVLRQARYLGAAVHPDAAMDLLQELLEHCGPGAVRWRALTHAGRLQLELGRVDRAVAFCDEALEGARRHGDDRWVGDASAALGMALTAAGRHREAITAFGQGRDGEGGPKELESVLSALPAVLQRHLDEVALRDGVQDRDGALAASLRAIKVATDLGLDRAFGGVATGVACLELLRAGRWDEAAALTDAWRGTAEHAAGSGRPASPATVAGMLLAVRRGDASSAEETLSRIDAARLPVAAGVDWRLVHAIALAELLRDHHRWNEARAAVRAGIDDRADVARSDWLVELVTLGVAIEADMATWARPRRHAAAAGESLERAAELEAWARSLVAVGEDEASPESLRWRDAARARVAAELSRCRSGDSAAWERAVATADAALGPYERASSRMEWAAAALRAGAGRDAIRRVLLVARADAARLSARPLLDGIDRLARRARIVLDSVPGVSGETDARAAARARGLSEREVDVLERLAAGESDREIAAALFITARTAGHHVSHIPDKLGVARRGEAAAAAHRLGLGVDGADDEASR